MGGLLFAGLPCSAHVWINSGTSKKNRLDPRGSMDQESTVIGNMLACRFALVALVALVRQIWWVTEQPNSSVAQYLPYLEIVLNPCRHLLGFAPGLCQRLTFSCNKPIRSWIVLDSRCLESCCKIVQETKLDGLDGAQKLEKNCPFRISVTCLCNW